MNWDTEMKVAFCDGKTHQHNPQLKQDPWPGSKRTENVMEEGGHLPQLVRGLR